MSRPNVADRLSRPRPSGRRSLPGGSAASKSLNSKDRITLKKATHFEFTKVLIFSFLILFAFHLGLTLYSILFNALNFDQMSSTFVSTLAFYGGIFAGYLGKATFENYDKNKNQLTRDLELGNCAPVVIPIEDPGNPEDSAG